ncbi:MAG TPA: undecaprenyl-phosphate glucose phosphotransferase [Thermoanaerobaculia bacterium]|nr:undecaprenyl-phosphate glucose phosphotransferase [Thermoanaerobaculia bacterium]
MIQQRHRTTSGAYLAGDLGATLAAFLTAWVLRFHIEVIPVTKSIPEFEPYLRLLPFILAIWPVVFYFHGLYQSRRGKSRVDEVLTVAVAVLLATVLLLVVIFLYRPPTPDGGYFTYSRAFLGLFALGDFLFVATARMVLRSVLLRIRQSNNNLQRILVVGAGLLGREITQKLLAHRELGFEVVGFLDDDQGKVGSSVLGVPVLGTLRQAEEVLAVGRIDQVFIALPLEAHRKMLQMLELMARECVEVKLVPDVLQYATLQATLEDVDGTPVINLSQVPLQGWNSMVKRSMDLLLAAAALVVLIPFFPLVALAIWLEDRGPIFYRQERMGLDGKPFMIVKFRSMRINAEATSGPVWAIKDDPRRTRIGTFLRHWSLDELPQIWNVLMGDMSIIGPRPERPTFVSEFKHKIPRYMLRHRVKAGITGWAQVHGWRGNTSIKKRIQYDLYYIQNWSLKLDFKILWMTVRHALRHNAY